MPLKTKTKPPATPPKLLLVLPWLSLPLVAAFYLVLWDRIPALIHVHFARMANPNVWITRGQSLAYDLGLLLLILVTGNLKMRRDTAFERDATLGTMLLAVTFAALACCGLLVYNISTSPF